MIKKIRSYFRSNRIWIYSLRQLIFDKSIKLKPFFANHQNPIAAYTPNILIATSMACYDHAAKVESTLGVALTWRGAHVEYLLCDQVLPCCQMTKIFNIEPEDLLSHEHTSRCKACQAIAKKAFQDAGMHVLWFSQFLSEQERAEAFKIATNIPENEIAHYRYRGLEVGEHAQAGALRFFARGDFNNEPHAEKILRRYLLSSIISAIVILNLFTRKKYEVAVFHHGIYVPQGVIGEACRKKKVRVVNWNPSYRKQTFIFSHGDSYHHTMIDEPINNWINVKLNDNRENIILNYLKSRRYGTEDWIWFHEKPVFDIESIQRELGIQFSKPCVGLLTSVMWDAQLHYKSNAFKSMLEWVFFTIQYFINRPDIQLVIRIHPAETTGFVPSRQRMGDEIKSKFPVLPQNIVVVPPESQLSTYALMEKCNAVIIYNTKTGIEIASMGIPVIVAGEAWIRNKGFSIDISSPAHYLSTLNSLPFTNRMSDSQVKKARTYAFHFFFRRMIELPFIVPGPTKAKFTLAIKNPDDLKKGNFRGLDVICDGIIKGTSFIVEPEMLG